MNPSEQIKSYIKSTPDWQGDILSQLHTIILAADPAITEEWKWDVPVFSHNGMVCAISSFKDHVKINFFKGAKLIDRHNVINNGLESKSHRSIDFYEGDKINEVAIKDLVRQAVVLHMKK